MSALLFWSNGINNLYFLFFIFFYFEFYADRGIPSTRNDYTRLTAHTIVFFFAQEFDHALLKRKHSRC